MSHYEAQSWAFFVMKISDRKRKLTETDWKYFFQNCHIPMFVLHIPQMN